MDKMRFISTSTSDLTNFITEREKSISKDIGSGQITAESNDLLTRKDVASYFQIDLGTVHNWTNKGYLKSYGIGRRVYYKRSEVEDALTPLK